MSLQAWLEKEFILKKEFIKQEVEKSGALKVTFTKDNKRFIIPELFDEVEPSKQFHLPVLIPFHEKLGSGMALDESTFSLLKRKFRAFKFQNKNKEEDRIKLQIHISKKTLSQFDKISKDNNLKDTVDCLEYITNKHYTNQQEHKKEIENLKTELQYKEDKIRNLEHDVSSLRKIIKQEENVKNKSRDDLVNYLIRTSINANCKLAEYESFIKNQSDLNLEIIPLLSQEEAQKIKTKFEKELGLTRLKIYALNSSDLVEGIDNFKY
ncbi:hypothetical protein MMP61_17400 [Acinetobacter sp. NIPH 1958]|uniref:hypothetical protein n=1 Tax=Acinetobacter sp. NIPH 1958 TaxID=2923430 RepID=UPI001F4A7C59|nr:hypothetical protein [Acinetobacter sp. NIPH 1958]MCH7357324.1 hypothetical protein [Acinetobacter sp. NIPH 1958]